MTWNARDYGPGEAAQPGRVPLPVDGTAPAPAPDTTPEHELLRLLADPMAPPLTWHHDRPSMALRLEMAQAGLVPDGDWARIRKWMTRGILEE